MSGKSSELEKRLMMHKSNKFPVELAGQPFTISFQLKHLEDLKDVVKVDRYYWNNE